MTHSWPSRVEPPVLGGGSAAPRQEPPRTDGFHFMLLGKMPLGYKGEYPVNVTGTHKPVAGISPAQESHLSGCSDQGSVPLILRIGVHISDPRGDQPDCLSVRLVRGSLSRSLQGDNRSAGPNHSNSAASSDVTCDPSQSSAWPDRNLSESDRNPDAAPAP